MPKHDVTEDRTRPPVGKKRRGRGRHRLKRLRRQGRAVTVEQLNEKNDYMWSPFNADEITETFPAVMPL